MFQMKPLAVFFSIFAFATAHAVDFNREVRPILSDKCFACHGPDEHDRKADLRLDTAEGAMEDLGGYAAFVPKDLKNSEAWYRIITDDPDEIMPPPKMHKPFTADEKRIIKEWIEEGAEYELHWSFQALERPEVPKTRSNWPQNEIDQFIFKAQLDRGMAPNQKADPITLARRLHLDLLGLPPNPEVVGAFKADPSAAAYQKLIDDLLANPAFGERMAVYWLDLVRYADTIGYHSDNMMEVSAYRDYVIDSFNENLPYDQFTIDQLAGDLLENPTLKQKIASGYNRLLQSTEEGGAQAKEYMAIHAADRVRNVSGVWLGTTIGCAQCHDHKYDPFSAKDFYSLAAFFADVKEKPIGKRQPNLKLPSEAEQAEMADLKQKLVENTVEKVLARDAKLQAQLAADQNAWETESVAKMESGAKMWTVIVPEGLKSSGGATLKPQPDGSILSTGKNPAKDNYTVALKAAGKITAVRLEALTHDSFPHKRMSRGNGNFVLTGFSAKIGDQLVKIASAKADFSQNGYPVANALDGKDNTGWAGNGHVEAANRTAVFQFEKAVELAEGQSLTLEMKHQSAHSTHNIGRFRVSVTDATEPTPEGGSGVPLNVQELLKVAAGERDEKQKKAISDYYQGIAPALAKTRQDLVDWKKRLESVEKGIQTMLVSEKLPTPRTMRILPRGNWLDDSGEEVQPAVPVFLPHEPIEDRRANRLDLAKWIMADTNPLTARTFVNRLWKLFYGAGISSNLEDLGGQGVPPTHPELLDWLAVEFRDSGWDVKHMVKLMLTSATYQQSSIETAEMRESDPGNQWLTRQGRWRLEAEFVRDTALDLSGLLVNSQGGKSVKPYQPAGYWEHLNFPRRTWKADQGESIYRRGLYTFWCRSFLHPAMLAFDAPSREECTAERPRSNTPQQALVLLNDPVFVEASRAFAAKIAKAEGDPAAKVRWAWNNAVSRAASEDELKILSSVYKDQQKRYTSDEAAAKELLGIGASEPPSDVPNAELAAWTQVARAILNAYETTARN